MFAVLFEVHPRPDQWDAYLGNAKLLRPELEQIDGFVDNIRYRSLTRDGWLLSLSSWRDEKALVRWRTHGGHHVVQEKGRSEILLDYHLRVGQLTRDTRLPPGSALLEQRLDETQTGEGTTVTLIDAKRPPEWVKAASPEACAEWLGLDRDAPGLVVWDVFDAVLTPGDVILVASWRDHGAAEAFEAKACLPEGARARRVRVVRDYGMFDCREAPQYYPDVQRGPLGDMSAKEAKRPGADVDEHVGSFALVNGKIDENSALKQIRWMVQNILVEVANDPVNWRMLYRDRDTGDLWEETFPLSEMHGGGPPTLTRISIDEASRRYKIQNER